MAVTEAEVRFVALQLLARSPSGFMTTTELIDALENYHFNPSGTDALIGNNRSDTRFSAKVRNLVSHRDKSTSLESRGYAEYIPVREGWQITDSGRNFISSTARI